MERHRYIVRLSKEERQELEAIVKKGKGDRTVDWQFTTADARIKLKRLYPSIIS